MSVHAGVPAHHIAGTNFIMVHLDLVDDLDGDFHAAMLLDRIRFRAGSGWWTATQADLIADTRLSEHQVKRALKHLRDAGFIESKRVSPYDPTQMFRVVVCDECPENTETTVNVKSSVTRSGESPTVREDFTDTSGRKSPSLPLSKNVRELDKNPPISPHGFDEFWDAYPRKKGKGQARTAWVKAVKKTDPAVIVTAAVQFRQWCEQDGTEAQFIPHPSTWLNGERWTDERDQSRSRTDGWIDLLAETMDNGPQRYPQLEG